ncbi:hypothetical protein L211DRAFT_871235 [Terfezia boudieri ATCC MYA-4762]|uniref:Uncharacterized protein n=1 Tax=Terfezia boudieri ATCC MYA-4762 TaxID=1051890 RepID=A0A3N4L9D8_9PEZI|nr:hypothetical protein L211DRAFT_871235 [Terfezia boudieri ATCC MYA-4762]
MTGGKTSDLATILVEDPDPEFKQDMPNGKIKGRARRRNSNSPTLDVAERLGFPNSFPKALRRERKPFSHEEDDALLKGFQVTGALLTRDKFSRFRNAFPDKYTQAGFKAKPKHPPKPPRSCPTTGTSEELNTDPLDSSSVEPQHQFDTPTDVSGLEDFNLGPPSQLEGHHDHHSDDHSRKAGDSDFNVSIIQEFLGANSSMRDWDPDADSDTEGDHHQHHHHHHHHHHRGDSLFASSASDGHDGRNSPSTPGVGVGRVVTSSMQAMSVEATLVEDFRARIFDQGDLFPADQPGEAVGKEGSVGVGHEDEDRVEGGGVAHDLVRWEDMVTHPIFTLDTGPPAPGMGMDGSVTLAPINPALLGGVQSGEGGESVVPGLSALLEEINGGAESGGDAGASALGVGDGMGGPERPVTASSVARKRQNTGRRKRKDKVEEVTWGEGEGDTGGVMEKRVSASAAAREKRRRTGDKKTSMS